MPNKYLAALLLATIAIAAEDTINKKQQVEIILFKNDSINMESDNVLYPTDSNAKYKMHSYYEAGYQNLITRSLADLTFVNFENKPYSSVIGQSISADKDMITATSKHLKYPLLNSDHKQLNDVRDKISKQQEGEVILHIAWQQLEDHNVEKKYLLDSNILDKTDDVNPEYKMVYGTITAKNSNNLDLKLDLILDKDNDKHNFFAAKRIKAGQLTYIDNNNYGMLILLSNI